jgi:hypothetical protein
VAASATTEFFRTSPNEGNLDDSKVIADALENDRYDEEEDRCFSIDYSFLDNISIDDARLQHLISPELLKQKKIDLDKILEENGDYFHHLFSIYLYVLNIFYTIII